MSQVDLTRLDAGRLYAAVDWMNSLAQAGAHMPDIEGLVLADVGLRPEDLDAWALRQAPTLVRTMIDGFVGGEEVAPGRLEQALYLAATGAMSVGALIVLKAIQDTQVVTADA